MDFTINATKERIKERTIRNGKMREVEMFIEQMSNFKGYSTS
jgi:hypothetical protein